MQLHYELRHGRLLDDRLGIGLRVDHPQPSPDECGLRASVDIQALS